MAGLFQQLFGGANTADASASADAKTTTQLQSTATGAPAAQPTQQTAGPQQAVAAPQGTGSPLDNYLAIWQTAPNDQQKVDPFQADVVPMGAEQMQLLQNKVSGVNFLASVPAETISAALGGDVQAFSSVLNTAVQQALLQSVRVNGTMLNSSMRNRTQEILAAMPTHVQQALNVNQIRQDNPVFNHPAARQLLGALEQNLSTQHPGISPTEASQVAQRFLQDFAAEVAGKPTAANTASQAPGSIDWSKQFSF
jgi:hypothetical protein